MSKEQRTQKPLHTYHELFDACQVHTLLPTLCLLETRDQMEPQRGEGPGVIPAGASPSPVQLSFPGLTHPSPLLISKRGCWLAPCSPALLHLHLLAPGNEGWSLTAQQF